MTSRMQQQQQQQQVQQQMQQQAQQWPQELRAKWLQVSQLGAGLMQHQIQNGVTLPQWVQCSNCKSWRVTRVGNISQFQAPPGWTCNQAKRNPRVRVPQCGDAMEKISGQGSTNFTQTDINALEYQRNQKLVHAEINKWRNEKQKEKMMEQSKNVANSFAELFNQSELEEAERKADERRARRALEREAIKKQIEQRKAAKKAKKKSLRKKHGVGDDDEEYVPDLADDSTDSEEYESDEDSDPSDSGDEEENYGPSRKELQARNQSSKPGDLLNRALYVAIQESNGRWNLPETQALAQYATQNGRSNWDGVGNHQLLRARHNNPQDCEKMFNSIMTIAKKLKEQQAKEKLKRWSMFNESPSETGSASPAQQTGRGRRSKRKRKSNYDDDDDDEEQEFVMRGNNCGDDSMMRVVRRSERPQKKVNYAEDTVVDKWLEAEEEEMRQSRLKDGLAVNNKEVGVDDAEYGMIIPPAEDDQEKIEAILDDKVVWFWPPEKQKEMTHHEMEMKRIELKNRLKNKGKQNKSRNKNKKKKKLKSKSKHKKDSDVDSESEGDTSEESEVEIPLNAKGEIEFHRVQKFLIKLDGVSHKHCEWMEESVLFERFEFHKAKRKIQSYERKARETKKKNDMLWGGEPFNPDFLQVDRIIDMLEIDNIHEDSKETSKEKSKEKSKENSNSNSNSNSNDEEKEKKNVKYLVKWKTLSYSQCTYETVEVIDDAEKIELFHKYNTPPSDIKIKKFNDVETRKRAGDGWYDKTKPRSYKNNHQLRDYQIEGINFLIQQTHKGFNCILADEMGLGKTVQSVTFLEHLCRIHNMRGPFLIVAPLSTIYHWQREIEEWTDFNCVVYHDSTLGARSRAIIRNYEFYYGNDATMRTTKFNILLTTYEICVTDVEWLADVKWQFLVVDEGHRLKNKTTKLAQAFEMMKIDRRLLLTGTPIQNSIGELFNLLMFLEPDQFSHSAATHYQVLEDAKKLAELRDIINPFILRRLKTKVEKSIPDKEERIIDVELTTLQKQYYRALYDRNREFLEQGVQKSTLPNLINLEVQLRKCCNHPWLIEGTIEREGVDELDNDEYCKRMIEASGKMVLLDKLLAKLEREGHKVLIFSQMRKMLDILEEMMKYRNYRFERFDGTTKSHDRQAAIDRFCSPKFDILVFLLTTRAGGQGLNLVAADTVIIFDSDWNPQQDIQAQARCHRIGQTRAVSVYRLVTRKTYEARMFERASKKLGLGHAILKSVEYGVKAKDVKDLKHLDNMLRYGAYSVLNENEEDREKAKKWEESNIDEILQHCSHKVQTEDNNGEKQDDKNELGIHSFTRSTFQSQQADENIDVEADNFWAQIFENEENEDAGIMLDDKIAARRLLKKLEKQDSQIFHDAGKKHKWWKKFRKHMTKICKLKEDGQEIPNLEDQLALVATAMNWRHYWNEEENSNIEKWYKTMKRRGGKHRHQTLNEDQMGTLNALNGRGRRGKKARSSRLSRSRRSGRDYDDDCSGNEREGKFDSDGIDLDMKGKSKSKSNNSEKNRNNKKSRHSSNHKHKHNKHESKRKRINANQVSKLSTKLSDDGVYLLTAGGHSHSDSRSCSSSSDTSEEIEEMRQCLQTFYEKVMSNAIKENNENSIYFNDIKLQKRNIIVQKQFMDPLWHFDYKRHCINTHTGELSHSDICRVCNTTDDRAVLLCDGPCVEAYHLECAGLNGEPEGDVWFCNKCVKLREKRSKIYKKSGKKSSRFLPGKYKIRIFVDNSEQNPTSIKQCGEFTINKLFNGKSIKDKDINKEKRSTRSSKKSSSSSKKKKKRSRRDRDRSRDHDRHKDDELSPT